MQTLTPDKNTIHLSKQLYITSISNVHRLIDIPERENICNDH